MRKEITEEQITELMQAIPRAEEVDRLKTEVDTLRAQIDRLREALTDIANQETTGPYKWHSVVEHLCEIAREALEGKP